MASIGDLDVDILRGRPVQLKNRVELWEREGYDGYGARLNALGHGEFQLLSVVYVHGNNANTNEANAEAHIADAAALQGTVVEIEDDFGETYGNVLVKRMVEEGLRKQRVIYKGDANAVRIEIPWEMVRTA